MVTTVLDDSTTHKTTLFISKKKGVVFYYINRDVNNLNFKEAQVLQNSQHI